MMGEWEEMDGKQVAGSSGDQNSCESEGGVGQLYNSLYFWDGFENFSNNNK